MTKFDDKSKYYQSYLYMGYSWAMIVLIMLLLSSCYVYESSYSPPQHNCELMERGQQCLSDHRCCENREHSTQVYYHNDLPYWGFYNDYYYYYGIRHMYPWWYYYTLRPNYIYNVSTHVYVTCNTGYYIGKPRGPKFSNNRGGTYKPTNTVVVKTNRTNGRTVKPIINRTNIKTNVNKTNIRTNTNKTNVKINRTNTNKSNVKINRNNINKNNVKINRSNTNRTNINKSKNINRNNKSNTRKPR